MWASDFGSGTMKLTLNIKIYLAAYFTALLIFYGTLDAWGVGESFSYAGTVLHALLVMPAAALLIIAVFPDKLTVGFRSKIYKDLPTLSRSTKPAYLIGALLLLCSPSFSFVEESNQLFWEQEAESLKDVHLE